MMAYKVEKHAAAIPYAHLKPGKLYRMVHSRKGTAIVLCVKPYDDGGVFVVQEGELHGINDSYGPGDEITTVNSLAKFYPAVQP